MESEQERLGIFLECYLQLDETQRRLAEQMLERAAGEDVQAGPLEEQARACSG